CSYLLRELSERRSDPAGLRDSGTSSGREASGPGTTATRLLEFGPNTPGKRTGCRRGKTKGPQPPFHTAELQALQWSGRLDLNQRPLAPQASALPGCATPRKLLRGYARAFSRGQAALSSWRQTPRTTATLRLPASPLRCPVRTLPQRY